VQEEGQEVRQELEEPEEGRLLVVCVHSWET